MIVIWAAVAILAVMLLLTLACGLCRAASRGDWRDDEQLERLAEARSRRDLDGERGIRR